MSVRISLRVFLLFTLFFLLGIACVFLYEHTNQVPRVFAPTSFFSLQYSPRDSLKGEIISLSGEVEWESRVATEASKINKPQIIQQGESLSTKNGKVSAAFSKRALFSLGPKTSINIIQTLPQNLVVEEPQGRVEYNITGLSPFSIKSLGLIINATSTADFTVKVTGSQVNVIMSTGSLNLAYTDTNNTSQVVRIDATQNIIYDDNTKEVTLR